MGSLWPAYPAETLVPESITTHLLLEELGGRHEDGRTRAGAWAWAESCACEEWSKGTEDDVWG